MTELAALKTAIEHYKSLNNRKPEPYIPQLIEALERAERTVRKHQAFVDKIMKYV